MSIGKQQHAMMHQVTHVFLVSAASLRISDVSFSTSRPCASPMEALASARSAAQEKTGLHRVRHRCSAERQKNCDSEDSVAFNAKTRSHSTPPPSPELPAFHHSRLLPLRRLSASKLHEIRLAMPLSPWSCVSVAKVGPLSSTHAPPT